MKIDAGSHIPIYLQIADQLRTAIAAGVYRPGEALPSLRVLALDIKVNPNTVQRAYDELLREETVYSQRGRGLFVAEQGAATAQHRTEEAVLQAFDETVQNARSAGMHAKQVRGLFSTSIRRVYGEGRQQP